METMMSFAVTTEHVSGQKTPFVVNTIDIFLAEGDSSIKKQ